MAVVLASASPRRKDLLEAAGIKDFIVAPVKADETPPTGLSPGETVMEISARKCRAAAKEFSRDDVIIAADTLVYLDGLPVGKPACEEEARAMLGSLAGRKHTVYTGLCVISGSNELRECEATDVFFRKLSSDEIDRYIKAENTLDKAGAYGAQGMAALFIERVEGDFFNVVGLPLCRLCMMLRRAGAPVTGLDNR